MSSHYKTQYSFVDLMGLVLILLGAIVIIAWYSHIPRIILITPKTVGIVFNSAICFVLVGIGFLLNNPDSSIKTRFQMGIGALLMLIAGLIFSQDVFNINLGIDQLLCKVWLLDSNPNPGRISPVSCISFILIGLIFIVNHYAHRKFIAISLQILATFILLFGIVSLVGFAVKIELIYPFYHFSPVPILGALGIFLCGINLWAMFWQQTWFENLYRGREDTKIMLLSTLLLLSVALIAGISGFSTYADANEKAVKDNLYHVLQDKINTFENALHNQLDIAEEFKTHAEFVELLLQPDAQHIAHAQTLIQQYQNQGLLSLAVYNPQSHLVLGLGQLNVHKELSAALAPNDQTLLSWKNGWILQVTQPLNWQGEPIGSVVSEWALPSIDKLMQEHKKGIYTDLKACYEQSHSRIICFPGRSDKQIQYQTYDSEQLPMAMQKALQGQKGVEITSTQYDEILAIAYSPVGTLKLAMILKANAADIFKPIRTQLNIGLIVISLILVMGLALLYWQVMPLVKAVTLSERRLRESEAYKTAILDSTLDSILTIDAHHHILSCNNKALETFACTQEELLYQPLLKLIPQLPPKLQIANVYATETTATRCNGQSLPVELSISKMDNIDSVAYVVVIKDITERKKIEQLKKEFVSVVNHELRTPLTSIRGSLGLLVGGALGKMEEKAQKMLNIAYNNCERLIRLVNDILDIEKIEIGKLEFHLAVADLNTIAEEAIFDNQGYADKFQVQMKLCKLAEPAIVLVDHDRLMQVFTNLLSNAIKFSPAGETVTVTISQLDGKFVRVAVSDHGAGIPEDFHGRIFQKFAQADVSARKLGGTGLGLSICKAIIEKLNGKIGFSSKLNAGSTFYFDLPLWQDQANA